MANPWNLEMLLCLRLYCWKPRYWSVHFYNLSSFSALTAAFASEELFDTSLKIEQSIKNCLKLWTFVYFQKSFSSTLLIHGMCPATATNTPLKYSSSMCFVYDAIPATMNLFFEISNIRGDPLSPCRWRKLGFRHSKFHEDY